MKFNILPQQVIEFEIFEKGKKQIWVWVTWGKYDWQTFHTNDFEAFQNCTTIEEIQKVVDEKIKTIEPVTKDKTFKINEEFVGTNWDNLYNIENLRKAFGTDDSEAFTNVSSGGGANTEIWFEKNLSNKDYNEVIDEEDEGLEPLTIYEAAKRWKDDILTENGWKSGTETFYETPLRVLSTEEKPKTKKPKTAEESKFGKRVFLKIEKFLFNGKILKRYQIYNGIFYVTLKKKSDYKKLHKGIRAEFKKLTKSKGSVNIFAVGKKRDKNIDEEHQYGFKFVDKKDEE